MKTQVSDPSTILGIIAAFCLIAAAMYLGGDPHAFIDVPSVLIVILGTFFLAMACFSVSDVFKTFATTGRTIVYRAENPSESELRSIQIAEIARKKGVLELENHQDLMHHNPIFHKAVQLIVDGIAPEQVEKILSQEMYAMSDRHGKSTSVLRKCAEISPAMGLIGTLIGLVQMLGNLDDPSSIGPAMAVALLTTFYGAVMAYMIFIPLASKLERNSKVELMTAEIYINAAASIARKENPRQLEILLNSILPPPKRIQYFEASA